MTNLSSIFRKSWFMSWIWTSFNIFHLKASIFAILFHLNSLTKFKNSEKKLVNLWFCYWNSFSFVAALCLWLISSYVCFRSEMNRSRVQKCHFEKMNSLYKLHHLSSKIWHNLFCFYSWKINQHFQKTWNEVL